MKRIIIVFLALFLVVPLFAQESGESDIGFKRGYEFSIEAGTGIVTDHFQYYAPIIKLNAINSYQFTPHMSAGTGIGLLYFVDNPMFPIFIEVNYTILKRSVSPYLSSQVGYSLNLKPDRSIPWRGTNNYTSDYSYWGGGFVNPAIGFKIMLTNNKISCINIDIGYNLQYAHRSSTYAEGSVDERYSENEDQFHIFCLNLGLSF